MTTHKTTLSIDETIKSYGLYTTIKPCGTMGRIEHEAGGELVSWILDARGEITIFLFSSRSKTTLLEKSVKCSIKKFIKNN